MKLVFLPAAVHDLGWFRRYYKEVFPEGAKRAAEQYRKAVETVGERPYVGRPIAREVREYAIPRTPFSLIYRIAGERVEVLRFWDQRVERMENWLDERRDYDRG